MALLLAAGINAIHPFNDGNGRTSRLVYALLHDDYTGTPEEKKRLSSLLGEYGRFEEFDINPAAISGDILNSIKENDLQIDLTDPLQPNGLWQIQKRDLQFPESLPKKTAIRFQQIMMNEYSFAFVAVAKYLQDNSQYDNPQFKKTFYRDAEKQQPERTNILVNEIIQENGASAIDGIFQKFNEVKVLYVRILIDLIAHPDKYQNPKGKGTLKEYFETSIPDINSIQKN